MYKTDDERAVNSYGSERTHRYFLLYKKSPVIANSKTEQGEENERLFNHRKLTSHVPALRHRNFVCPRTVRFFMYRAWKRGKEIGLTEQKMKSVITGSALFSIVPSIPILIILVMLMSVLGKYFPWLRLSVIGSSSYENVAANIAARSFGLLSYTDEGYNASIFVSTMWAMSICILYEPLLVIFGQKSWIKA